MNKIKAKDFHAHLRENLKDKKFKKYFDEHGKQLEIAYKIVQLRKSKKMSQLDLAEMIGSTQSNVARMESGQQNFTVALLNKIANAFGRKLKISFS